MLHVLVILVPLSDCSINDVYEEIPYFKNCFIREIYLSIKG